jgi:hypothetical protein
MNVSEITLNQRSYGVENMLASPAQNENPAVAGGVFGIDRQ